MRKWLLGAFVVFARADGCVRGTGTADSEDDDSRQPGRWLGPDRPHPSSGHAKRQTGFVRAVR